MNNIKQVQITELNSVMEIINDAKKLLSKDSLQWQQGYPNEKTMSTDIINGHLFGHYIDDKLVGIEALVPGINEHYVKIDGKWLSNVSEKDLVIHRIAVKQEYHHLHIGDILFKFAESYAKENGYTSIKIDTHIKNTTMQHLLKTNDYTYCGIIFLLRDEVDNSRLAYEKLI